MLVGLAAVWPACLAEQCYDSLLVRWVQFTLVTQRHLTGRCHTHMDVRTGTWTYVRMYPCALICVLIIIRVLICVCTHTCGWAGVRMLRPACVPLPVFFPLSVCVSCGCVFVDVCDVISHLLEFEWPDCLEALGDHTEILTAAPWVNRRAHTLIGLVQCVWTRCVYPPTHLTSSMATCLGRASPAAREVATDEPGWTTWK